MYSVGQTVLYGSNGVCNIADITIKHIGRTDMEYYVLKPLCTTTSTLFVPTQNEQLVKRIRFVLSEPEINGLLKNLPECFDWNDNKTERTDFFKSVISDSKCEDLIKLIRTIHKHAAVQAENGKRLHASDERILREAEKMVGEEISVVLGITRDEAVQLLLKDL